MQGKNPESPKTPLHISDLDYGYDFNDFNDSIFDELLMHDILPEKEESEEANQRRTNQNNNEVRKGHNIYIQFHDQQSYK